MADQQPYPLHPFSSAGAPTSTPTSTRADSSAPSGVNVEIERTTFDRRPLRAYVATPHGQGDGPFPAVVIIHELFGINDNIRDIAQRFADEGYVALAVDLFSSARSEKLCVMRVMSALVTRPLTSKGIGEIRLAIDWLSRRDDVAAEQIAAIGFCMGGGYALGIACVDSRVKASSVFYCINPRPLKATAGACPIVGSYAGTDGFTSKHGQRLDVALDDYGVPHDVKVYEGADHSFFNDTLDGFHPEAAADAWQRTIAFFLTHVRGQQADA